MAKLLKLRRGTTTQHSSFTGAEGEVTVDTTKDTLVVHDGSTAGGKPLATEAGNTATATTATNVTVADESSDTSCNVLFTTAATGNLPPKSGTNLTFNSSTGVLTATGFAGPITGDVTGNVTGNTSGTAATVTGAAQSNITSTGTLTGLTVTGDVVLDNGTNAGKDITWDASADALIMNDDVQLQLGTGSDMRFYHSGSHGYLNVVTGNLEIRTNGSEAAITCTANAGVDLYYDTAQEFATVSGGVKLYGHSESVITALTSASSVTIDFSLSNHFSITMGHNIAFGNPTTESVGQSGTIVLTQDGTGSRTASWGSLFLWAGGTAPTLSTAANSVDRIDYFVAAADKIHCVASLAMA